MPGLAVYIAHASPNDDAICQEFVTALRDAGVPQLHYEAFDPATRDMLVIVIGELRTNVALLLLSSSALTSPIVQSLAEGEHDLHTRNSLRILLPVTVAPYDVADLWPFLAGYPRIESAPGRPYPIADAIKYTLAALALTPASRPGIGRLFNRGAAAPAPDPIIRATSLHWQGKDAEALAALDQLTKEQPQSFAAWYTLALLNEELQHVPQALAAYDRALAIDPTSADAWAKKAYLLDQQRQYQQGLDACEKALAINPNLAGAWYIKGYILDDLNRLDEALAAYERWKELDGEDAPGLSNMGITLRKMGRLEEAKAAQDRATELDASFAPAWINLANVLLEMNRPEEALAAAEKGCELNTTNPAFAFTKARALIALKRDVEAFVILNGIMSFPPALELLHDLIMSMARGK